MGVLALLGVALLAINCLSSMATAKPQGIGIGSKLSLGPLGSIGSGFNFQPGGGNGARTEGSTTPETTSNEEAYGVNSNLGIGKAGSIGSGFNFQPGPALKKTSPGNNTTAVTTAATTVITTTIAPAADRNDDFGLNTNLGLGKAGSLNSGFNFKKPGSGSDRAMSTTTESNNIGLGGGLGLGKAGSINSGVSFKPGKGQQKTTPARGKGVTRSKSHEEPQTTPTSAATSSTTNTPALNRQDDITTTASAEVTTTTATTSHSGWTAWGDWGECSTTCGFGLQKRNRTCEGQSLCFGLREELKGCSNEPCTLGLSLGRGLGGSGEWSEWSNWTDCSAHCGVGSQTRSRTCNGESCFGPTEMRQACVQSPCPQGEWGEWSEWAECSTTCGFGLQKRTRTCEGGICPGLNDMQRACPFKSC